MEETVRRESTVSPSLWGRHTYKLDAALPGKRVLNLYGMLSREEASILAQAQTGHARLSSYLARIKVIEDGKYSCGDGHETVSHALLWCKRRSHLRERAHRESWSEMGRHFVPPRRTKLETRSD